MHWLSIFQAVSHTRAPPPPIFARFLPKLVLGFGGKLARREF